LPPVPADANQIQQVVVNLLMNAADAIGDGGGTIRVGTAEAAVPPWGHAVIRAARCPKGCDLLDPGVRIGSYPAIVVAVRHRERDATMHLDPVYGRFSHRASEPFEAGGLGAYSCPRCRTRLEHPEHRCEECGAPAFAVQAGDRGQVEWCTRQGCHWTRWKATDALEPRPFAELVVEDSGRGISGPDMDRLFEPFFTTKGSRGVGLGLAVTWGIVEAHGGTIEVRSEPGRGTRFTVRLPLGAKEVAADAAGRAGSAGAQESAAPARVERPAEANASSRDAESPAAVVAVDAMRKPVAEPERGAA
jgi:signal transduction histidine kinase